MTHSTITLGPNGPTFSRLVLGLWRLADWSLTEEQRLELIDGALDLGITTFDHADIYGDYRCEELFGQLLAQKPALRDKLQIVTKCGIKLVSERRPEHKLKSYDTSREHIIASAENSLRLLQTDYIDLLLIHRPDPLMDADEVAEAFIRLKEAGKVRFFGVSNFLPHQFDLLADRLDFPLVTNQVELSVNYLKPLHNGIIDQCQKRRIAPMAWSPLGGGALFHSGEERFQRLRLTMEQIGEELGGATLSQVALAWLLTHPARVVPVLGTGKLHRLVTAVQALNLTLSREQWFAIWTASAGQEVP